MPAPQTQTSGGALAPFHYPAFRAIWTANLFSNIGSMIQSVGAAWLMTELTTSHVLVALVQASATIPILLLGVFAGAIADNFDRRRVMMAAQSAMLIVSAALAALSYTGNIGPWSLLALTLMVGMGTALNGPAWQASVRMQVGRADLPQAISLNAISFNLARSVGPALGGILISLWSTSLAFGLNAASYLGMIVVLMVWRPEIQTMRREPMLAAIGRGLRFCAGSPPIRKVLLRGLVIGFGAAGFQALMPSIARDMLRGSELDYGLMLGAFGIGSIITALWISRLRRRFGSEAIVTAASLIFIVALVLMASAVNVPMAVAASFIGGMGWVCAMTSLNVAMQLRSPEDILGRCLSIYQAVTFGGMALGAWAWGTVADVASLQTALYAAATWLALTLALHFFAPMPTREEGRLDAVPEKNRDR
ncbi:MAG: arabinose ABC transporter permease [Novosphingobium sp.]|nr:arabinose ABC transporter permease [Novosphingobium sp.]